jgi:hypothetical protein
VDNPLDDDNDDDEDDVFHFIIDNKDNRSRGSSVCISGNRMHDRATEIHSPAGAGVFSSNLCVQTGSRTQPASCAMGTGGPFLGVKRVRGETLTTHPL